MTDGMIILWVPSDKPQTGFGESSDDAVVDKEFWRAQRIIAYVKTVHLADSRLSGQSSVGKGQSTDLQGDW